MQAITEPTKADVLPLIHEQGQMVQDLMKQQAEAEEAFSYQIRDLQKQIISLKKQRAGDAEQYEDQIRTLQKQLGTADLQIEALRTRTQQLTGDVRDSATNAATDVLDQFNKTADPMLTLRLTKQDEKIGQLDKTVESMRRDMRTNQDDVDVQLESLSSRVRQLKDDIYAINQETVAKAVAETDLKGRSMTKMRGLLDELDGHIRTVNKTISSVTKRLDGIEGDLGRCKTTFYYFNEALKPHVERKAR